MDIQILLFVFFSWKSKVVWPEALTKSSSRSSSCYIFSTNDVIVGKEQNKQRTLGKKSRCDMKTDGAQLHSCQLFPSERVGSSASHAFLRSFFPGRVFAHTPSVQINYCFYFFPWRGLFSEESYFIHRHSIWSPIDPKVFQRVADWVVPTTPNHYKWALLEKFTDYTKSQLEAFLGISLNRSEKIAAAVLTIRYKLNSRLSCFAYFRITL